jgi:hypothetical protein
VKKKALAAFLILMIAALANGFQSSTEWVKYTSKDGRYSVLFPKQPMVGTQEGAAKTGEKLIQYMFQATDTDSFYMVAYFDITPSMVYSLDDGRAGMLEAVKGTLLKEEAISLGGSSGKEVKISAKNGDLDLLFRARSYAIGNRIYVIQHGYGKLSETPAMAEKTARFFDSFKVTAGK